MYTTGLHVLSPQQSSEEELHRIRPSVVEEIHETSLLNKKSCNTNVNAMQWTAVNVMAILMCGDSALAVSSLGHNFDDDQDFDRREFSVGRGDTER